MTSIAIGNCTFKQPRLSIREPDLFTHTLPSSRPPAIVGTTKPEPEIYIFHPRVLRCGSHGYHHLCCHRTYQNHS